MTTQDAILDQERIREQVRTGYAAVAVAGEDVRGREKRGCCGGGVGGCEAHVVSLALESRRPCCGK